jgi:hypothetical protein
VIESDKFHRRRQVFASPGRQVRRGGDQRLDIIFIDPIECQSHGDCLGDDLIVDRQDTESEPASSFASPDVTPVRSARLSTTNSTLAIASSASNGGIDRQD